MEPSLGGTSASPTHSFRLTVFFFFFFPSPVSWTPGCLIQQQRGRSPRARWRGISVEHEVQEGYAWVRLPLSGTSFPLRPHRCFPHPAPLLPSYTLWVHRTGIHLHHIYPQTHVREAPGEDLWRRSWMESKHCSRIKCVGQGWLSCVSKQGPCVQTS